MTDQTFYSGPVLLADELESIDLGLYHEKGQFVGLTQKDLPRFDRATLGMRGLMLLAAAPNVGKTALAVQMGMNAVRNNSDACFCFLSLEMPRKVIMTRMLCKLAKCDWWTLAMGREAAAKLMPGGEVEDPSHALALAMAELKKMGERIQILDHHNFPNITVANVVKEVEQLKRRSGCQRALVLVDYLQVFPIPFGAQESESIHSEEEANRWRVGAVKSLRDLCGDPVLVISEMEKAVDDKKEKLSMADVVGSPRAIYTPDMVFLLHPLPEERSLRILGGDPVISKKEMDRTGISFLDLTIAKGRDGVTRTTIPMTFFYRQTRFMEGFRQLAF